MTDGGDFSRIRSVTKQPYKVAARPVRIRWKIALLLQLTIEKDLGRSIPRSRFQFIELRAPSGRQFQRLRPPSGKAKLKVRRINVTVFASVAPAPADRSAFVQDRRKSLSSCVGSNAATRHPLFQAVRHVKLFIQAVLLIEGAVAVAIPNDIVPCTVAGSFARSLHAPSP